MGTLFKYISDEALEAYIGGDSGVWACPLCERERAILPVFASAWEGGLYEMCADCIRTVPTGVINKLSSEERIMPHLREVFPDLSREDRERRMAEIVAELRHTPRVPSFCQDDQWPLCCGDVAEYVGEGLPEGDDLGGLSLFECPRCGEKFEVSQNA